MANRSGAPASVESILYTGELNLRPSRPPNYEIENRALIALTLALADSPETILQTLSDTALEVLQCGTAGISMLTRDDGGKNFYWPAISGSWKAHIGGGTPRDFGPCGTVLDYDAPLLFKNVETLYTYLAPVKPRIEEALLAPFYLAGKAVGTVWAIAHDPTRKFDSEDRRQLVTLAKFASAAYQAVQALETNRKFSAIVESSDDAIVSEDLNGIILSWNPGAERIFGYTAEEAIGQSITMLIPAEMVDEEQDILRHLRAGEGVDHSETIRIKKDGTRIRVSLTISPIRDAHGHIIAASKIARDITQRVQIEYALREREMATRLLQVQDHERRRIARELHDGVGQLIAAMSMNISVVQLERNKLSKAAAERVTENLALVQQVAADIRTVSYLLHPPMLDEIGLNAVLQWYVAGFAERSKIDAKLEHPADWERLPEDVELCLFRVAQECLTNIHRHSKSPSALVRLTRDSKAVSLEVQDHGSGIDPKTLAAMESGKTPGVGVRGMKERVAAIGGKLTVSSDQSGTTIRVTVPSQKEMTKTAAQSW